MASIIVLMEQNRFGHLEISYPPTGRTMYVQVDYEVEIFKEGLSKRKRQEIEEGWPTRCKISDEYLPMMEEV